MQWPYLLFDLDGTLLDTSEGIKKSVEHTLRQLNLPALSDEVIRTFVGPPINRSLQQTFHLNDEETAHATAVFRDLYKNQYLFYAEAYQGIPELLDALRAAGYKLAVATYKREDYAVMVLEKFDLFRRFDVVKGCDFESKLTKTDIVKLALKELGCQDPKNAALVGDTVHDQTGAAACGMDFIAVTYGFGFKPGEHPEASVCFDDVPQLKAFLLKQNTQEG